MPGHDPVDAILRQWAAKAESDLKAAELSLRAGEDCPADTTCFHAQQRVEKFVKSLLIQRGVEPPMIHDIEALVELLPPTLRPTLDIRQMRALTRYATVTRYPGEYDPITLSEATEAVGIARRVRDEIHSKLPPEPPSR